MWAAGSEAPAPIPIPMETISPALLRIPSLVLPFVVSCRSIFLSTDSYYKIENNFLKVLENLVTLCFKSSRHIFKIWGKCIIKQNFAFLRE